MNDKDFRKGAFGTVWKDGKFFRFENERVLVLTGGTEPKCWQKTKEKPLWRGSRSAPNDLLQLMPAVTGLDMPAYRSGTNYVLEGGQVIWPFALGPEMYTNLALHHLQESIPPEIYRRVIRFRERRWQMYSFLARVPGAIDLCDSNPALAFMLANNWVFHSPVVTQPLRSARALVLKKQVNILEWLGLPKKGRVRKILRKVDPSAVSIESMLYLRPVFDDQVLCRILSRLPSINAGVIRLISDKHYRAFFSESFYRDIATRNYPCKSELFDLLMLVKDTVRMFGQCGAHHGNLPIKSFSSLQKIHDKLSLSEKWTQGLDEVFPDPPFPGTANIKPIRTVSELLEEALVQNNCCASYAGRVHKSYYYLYRARKPFRVTIGIACGGLADEVWYVQQIYRSSNHPIPEKEFNKLRDELFSSRKLPIDDRGYPPEWDDVTADLEIVPQ